MKERKKMKKNDDNETEKIPEIKMTVKKSPVGFTGSMRVNDSVLKKLGCEEKDQIVVIKGDKEILRTIFADDLVSENVVILRTKAMKDLGVEEGDEVTLRMHKELFADTKKKAGDLKEKIGDKIEDMKEKAEKKKEDKKKEE